MLFTFCVEPLALGIALDCLIVYLLWSKLFVVIPPYCKATVVEFGKLTGELDSGFHFMRPWAQLRAVPYTLYKDGKEKKSKEVYWNTSARSCDVPAIGLTMAQMVRVSVDVNIFFRTVDYSKLVRSNIDPGNILYNELIQIFSTKFGNKSPESLYENVGDASEVIKKEINDALQDDIGILVTGVVVEDVKFPRSITAATERLVSMEKERMADLRKSELGFEMEMKKLEGEKKKKREQLENSNWLMKQEAEAAVARQRLSYQAELEEKKARASVELTIAKDKMEQKMGLVKSLLAAMTDGLEVKSHEQVAKMNADIIREYLSATSSSEWAAAYSEATVPLNQAAFAGLANPLQVKM
jgi:regulator of protease activity HflC (stomatin/prohibitin superfamily)